MSAKKISKTKTSCLRIEHISRDYRLMRKVGMRGRWEETLVSGDAVEGLFELDGTSPISLIKYLQEQLLGDRVGCPTRRHVVAPR